MLLQVSITASLLAVLVTAQNQTNSLRDYMKHYEELQCKPIYRSDSTYVERYDCSSLENRNEAKCYLDGQEYEMGKSIPDSAITEYSCSRGCLCRGTDRAEIKCAAVDCPEFFGSPLDNGCKYTYELGGCCSSGTTCLKSGEQYKGATCKYGGKTYNEGERFQPEDQCTTCVCKEGFNGSTIEPWCKKIKCGIELHYSERVSEGCTPVYYGDKSCCPIEWRCPSTNDTVVRPINKTAATTNSSYQGSQCKFGSLRLNLGEELSPTSQACQRCSCIIPPMPTCVLDHDCYTKQIGKLQASAQVKRSAS